MKHALILALLLVAGCKMETPQVNRGLQPVEAIVTYSDETRSEMSVRPGNGLAKFGNGVTVEAFEDGVVRVCVGRFRPSEVDSAYSAGVHDGLNSQRTVIVNQSDSSAKVAAVMAANDITLPQVAAWLNTYNMDVVNRGAWMRPHWRPASGQVTYYMFRPEIAVADTTVEFMVRGHVPGAWPATVQGVLLLQNGSALRGPVSEIGWSDNGNGSNALPGISE